MNPNRLHIKGSLSEPPVSTSPVTLKMKGGTISNKFLDLLYFQQKFQRHHFGEEMVIKKNLKCIKRQSSAILEWLFFLFFFFWPLLFGTSGTEGKSWPHIGPVPSAHPQRPWGWAAQVTSAKLSVPKPPSPLLHLCLPQRYCPLFKCPVHKLQSGQYPLL